MHLDDSAAFGFYRDVRTQSTAHRALKISSASHQAAHGVLSRQVIGVGVLRWGVFLLRNHTAGPCQQEHSEDPQESSCYLHRCLLESKSVNDVAMRTL